jgi:FixJ family two-component response regulator
MEVGNMNDERTVFIVNDDAALCQSLAALMHAMDLGSKSFSSAVEYLDVFDPARSGCLLLEAHLPGMSGLELLEHINGRITFMPAIVISASNDVPTVVRAMRAGALNFLQKPFKKYLLCDAVKEALDWDAANRHKLVRLVKVRRRLENLTSGELAVMEKIMEGKCNRVIAGDLNVSVRTVEERRAKLMRKMKARCLAELIRMSMLAESFEKGERWTNRSGFQTENYRLATDNM